MEERKAKVVFTAQHSFFVADTPPLPYTETLSLKVLSDENQGGSKLVSIASSFFTV
jgi:hypothetical protein